MRKFVLFSAAMLLAAAAVAQPARTFVSGKIGNDANPCSLAAPCRNFQRAIDVVAGNGEVIALDSAGYGMFQTPYAMTVAAPAGVTASVTGTGSGYSGSGYSIQLHGSGTVTLRGLSITGAGVGGIIAEANNVRIDSCSFAGLNTGIEVLYGTVAITDSSFTGNAFGIGVQSLSLTTPSIVSIDNVRIEGSTSTAIVVFGPKSSVSVRNSVMAGSAFGGVSANTTADTDVVRVAIDRSVISGNVNGVHGSGRLANPDTEIVRVSNSVVAQNTKGILIEWGGQVQTAGNNTVVGNASNETFTGTFALK